MNSLTRNIVRQALGKNVKKRTSQVHSTHGQIDSRVAPLDPPLEVFFIFYFDLDFLKRVSNYLAIHAQIYLIPSALHCKKG
jgi:hypothetical protein